MTPCEFIVYKDDFNEMFSIFIGFSNFLSTFIVSGHFVHFGKKNFKDLKTVKNGLMFKKVET